MAYYDLHLITARYEIVALAFFLQFALFFQPLAALLLPINRRRFVGRIEWLFAARLKEKSNDHSSRNFAAFPPEQPLKQYNLSHRLAYEHRQN